MKKRCCFAGHGDLYDTDKIYNNLVNAVKKLITEENVTEFLVGNYGSFDKLSATAVRQLKKKYPHIQLNLIIPYLTSEINEHKEYYYKNYDNIIMANIPDYTPRKFHIKKCNEYMVQISQFLICYVEHGWGGAASTLSYAEKKKHITVFNLTNNK